MVALVIGTHGKSSEELLKSAEMIYGKQENVAAVTFEPGENTDDLLMRYREKMSELNCQEGVLFLVDLFGGSPFNAASRIAVENENMDVVTGVSIPMLLETFGVRAGSSVQEVLIVAKEAGIKSIKSLKETLSQSNEEDL
ncbi:PTS mannose transporter subunit IID [Clostridium sp. YIM B02505]|uniref:PTS mannose transporter subunit IID n=1 Tax=Clostridium yunnanense TaxID=2800325 RepID=A0ABS1ET00_9CLOT|nr:mannose/fructose/sorbose PTS transporter subunit IIA [Clostridium yunnanense]MBK1812450.1 PTS mannose transporter subunit IID [Clostridium yunnanense]